MIHNLNDAQVQSLWEKFQASLPSHMNDGFGITSTAFHAWFLKEYGTSFQCSLRNPLDPLPYTYGFHYTSDRQAIEVLLTI